MRPAVKKEQAKRLEQISQLLGHALDACVYKPAGALIPMQWRWLLWIYKRKVFGWASRLSRFAA